VQIRVLIGDPTFSFRGKRREREIGKVKQSGLLSAERLKMVELRRGGWRSSL